MTGCGMNDMGTAHWAELSQSNVGIMIADCSPGLVSGYLVMRARGGAGHCFFKCFWVKIKFQAVWMEFLFLSPT